MTKKLKFVEHLRILKNFLEKTGYKTVYNNESFMNKSLVKYIEDQYKAWRKNAENLTWNLFFRTVDNAIEVKQPHHSPHGLSLPLGKQKHSGLTKAKFSSSAAAKCDPASIKDHLEVQAIISAYQARGHLMATLDPLNITRGTHLKTKVPSEVIIRQHKVPSDLNRVFVLSNGTFIGGKEKALPLHEIIKRLETAYCQNIGVEYMYNTNLEVAQFMREKFETPGAVYSMSKDEKKLALKRLIRAHCFESFLAQKFLNEKRFGLEGCEVLIPVMKTMIDCASKGGTFGFNIGMAHRGRMNVLANICRKPLKHVFSQFHPVEPQEFGSGDLKYHLGTQVERINRQTNKPTRLTVIANPSHLECVAPIAVGKTYAEYFYDGKKDPNKFITVIIHGDAAVCGQGVVYETYHLSELPCHSTNGNIHIVINNQVGFTTDPRFSRSSEYCTEVAKVLAAPVFHVNADDVEACLYVMKVATEFRLRFKTCAVIDLVCYRRHGHNEADEPMFTQPIMYKKIANHKPTMYLYAEKLIREKVVTENEMKAMMEEYKNIMEQGFKEADSIKVTDLSEWLDSPWKKFFSPDADPLKVPKTAVSKDLLMKIGKATSTPPSNFEIHPKLKTLLENRSKLLSSNKVNWAMAEAMAFGSLLSEGLHIRLSGQDVQRGTLSHRHHVYHHQSQDKVMYNPLANLFPGKGVYTVCNSSLSELGVLGFELGYSMVSPFTLVLWEAQFGDFNNCAQCIIDQFIASGEAKWGRQAGVTMLLPHGLDGMGPEHSSCRPERFLLMANDNDETVELNMPKQLKDANWFVANLTTPANYFHILRRQMKLNYRKPLIMLSPKVLLFHPECVSPLDDMTGDSTFHPYIPDKGIQNKQAVKKVFICCGKVYYLLTKKRREMNLDKQIAIVRMEQLFPFPYADFIEDMRGYGKGYGNAKICWVQEEHKNQGCWIHVQPRILSALPKLEKVWYYGRAAASAPATGSKIIYDKEMSDIYKCFTD